MVYVPRSLTVAVVLLCSLSYPRAAAAQAGLVAAYSFDEGVGISSADSSGNGQTGTIAGATWNNAGKFGSALSFNGSSDWVTVNHTAPLDLTTALTVEAWVKPA